LQIKKSHVPQVRERIKGAYDMLKAGGRSGENTLAITVDGLCSRIIAKISSVTLGLLLRRFFGIDVLTYTINSKRFHIRRTIYLPGK